MSRFQYQTIQVSGTNIVNVGSPSHRSEGVGAIVQTALTAMQALQDWAIRRQTEQAVSSLGQSINQMLRQTVGVLVCIALEERSRPGGAIERNFRAAFIAGSGRNAREALNEFIHGPRLWQSPPSGFTRRESFIWVTSY